MTLWLILFLQTDDDDVVICVDAVQMKNETNTRTQQLNHKANSSDVFVNESNIVTF